MTLKKMSVAANDIVLNNLVMREKTFKTIPYQLCSVLLNLQFYPTQLGKTPLCIFKSSSRLLYKAMSILLLFLILLKFQVFLFFLSNSREFSYDLPCAGAFHRVCCRPSYPAQPWMFRTRENLLNSWCLCLLPVLESSCCTQISSTAGTSLGDTFLQLFKWTAKVSP